MSGNGVSCWSSIAFRSCRPRGRVGCAKLANPGKWSDWDLAWDCVQKLTEGGDGAAILPKPPESARNAIRTF